MYWNSFALPRAATPPPCCTNSAPSKTPRRFGLSRLWHKRLNRPFQRRASTSTAPVPPWPVGAEWNASTSLRSRSRRSTRFFSTGAPPSDCSPFPWMMRTHPYSWACASSKNWRSRASACAAVAPVQVQLVLHRVLAALEALEQARRQVVAAIAGHVASFQRSTVAQQPGELAGCLGLVTFGHPRAWFRPGRGRRRLGILAQRRHCADGRTEQRGGSRLQSATCAQGKPPAQVCL